MSTLSHGDTYSAAFMVVYIVLMCCENVRRSFPANLIMTGVLTLSIGYMTMMITSFYQIVRFLLFSIVNVQFRSRFS